MGIKATAGIRTGGIKAGTSTRNVEILPMPHITIGDVETLPAGSSATATMTGTIDYPVINLGIPQGETGETGSTGAKGDKGEKGDKGDKGDTGAKGDTGSQGPAGTAATIEVGTVSSGSTASVTNSGTNTAAVFNFTLPKGDTGETGSAATVSVGTVTSGSTASVTNSGTSSAAVLDFVLPKGDKGDTGNAGAAATISVGNVSSGSTASVTNSGTSSAAVFDFVLPKGDKGDTGTGIPSGGSDGQLVGKSSGSIAWVDPPVTDDHKWNDVALNKTYATNNGDSYVPYVDTTSSKTAYLTKATSTPGAGLVAKYNTNKFLISTTPTANDNSTKCATTAYVDAAIPTVPTNVSSFNNDAGYLTLSTLPIYDGSVT